MNFWYKEEINKSFLVTWYDEKLLDNTIKKSLDLTRAQTLHKVTREKVDSIVIESEYLLSAHTTSPFPLRLEVWKMRGSVWLTMTNTLKISFISHQCNFRWERKKFRGGRKKIRNYFLSPMFFLPPPTEFDSAPGAEQTRGVAENLQLISIKC